MSRKIERIEIITGKILAYARNHPQKSGELRQFLNYYLPTTLKILNAYAQMDAQGVEGENITAAKVRIEAMMDKVVDGFEKQLDQLFRGDAMDITSDVEVLERMLAKLCRKAAMTFATSDVKRITITEKNLVEYLDVPRYTRENVSKKDLVGVVNGLAWTEVGGELLNVEVNVMPGTGKLELTGNLGEVMQESCRAALSCLRARTAELGIEADFYKTRDIHIHFPEGAVPKDGPSAGITIATALLSALTNRCVRHDVAMTGEISLRGRVMPIGGLREKTMAALRAGIHTVILPKENEKDLTQIDQSVRAKLHFVPVETVDAVFAEALVMPEQCSCTGLQGYPELREVTAAPALRV
jgi:ATP-dependent Lon protease